MGKEDLQEETSLKGRGRSHQADVGKRVERYPDQKKQCGDSLTDEIRLHYFRSCKTLLTNRVQWGAAHKIEKSCAKDSGDPQKNVWERDGLAFPLERSLWKEREGELARW